MEQFVEVTAVWRDQESGQDRTEARMVNLANVKLITEAAQGRSMMYLHEGPPSILFTAEPYTYWSAMLTAWQPRRADK
jgi:hypothetical protein